MLSFLKRNRPLIIAGALLAYPGASFFASRGRARELNFFDRAVLSLSAWVQGALVSGVDGLTGVGSGYVSLRGVREENLRLREEVVQLRAGAQSVDELRAENERLRKLVAYSETHRGVKVVARVVGVNPVPTLLSLRINRGEADGVAKRLPVMTIDGVLGQVLRTTRTTADVLLLHDPNSRLGGRLQTSRSRVTVTGTGEPRTLRLENLLRTDPVEAGELVVTSGADGVFPGGLTVGKVISVDRQNVSMFQDAVIEPAVDPKRVEEVFVLVTPEAWQAEAKP
ncbi:MAG: rod shape-determining protein MreC [Myxococcaceae bacterium]